MISTTLTIPARDGFHLAATCYTPEPSPTNAAPTVVGLAAIGHFGFFRPSAAALWAEIVAWLEQACPHPVQ